MPEIAVIGGTGIYYPKMLGAIREINAKNRYGEVTISVGTYGNKEIAFLPRHGSKHNLPPHLINYRANIAALQNMGIKKILASATVGSLRPDFQPGDLILASQLLDFTKNRAASFQSRGYKEEYIRCSPEPYCSGLRQALETSSRIIGKEVKNGGVYVCTEGPRFETAAEIRMFQKLGGDLVGMTSVPEVNLAREAGMCYANVCLVSNMGAGLTTEVLNQSEIVHHMRSGIRHMRSVLLEAALRLNGEICCSCRGPG